MANTLSGNSNTDQSITVEEFIALRATDEITYYNYSILEYLDGFDMFITNLLYDYEDELKDIAVTIQLSEEERYKYRYKPYLLAYDIYGSTETEFILMMMNGIIDPKEFDFEKIKAIRPTELKNILNRIQAVDEDYMNTMASKLKEDFKNNEGNTIWA